MVSGPRLEAKPFGDPCPAGVSPLPLLLVLHELLLHLLHRALSLLRALLHKDVREHKHLVLSLEERRGARERESERESQRERKRVRERGSQREREKRERERIRLT